MIKKIYITGNTDMAIRTQKQTMIGQGCKVVTDLEEADEIHVALHLESGRAPLMGDALDYAAMNNIQVWFITL